MSQEELDPFKVDNVIFEVVQALVVFGMNEAKDANSQREYVRANGVVVGRDVTDLIVLQQFRRKRALVIIIGKPQPVCVLVCGVNDWAKNLKLVIGKDDNIGGLEIAVRQPEVVDVLQVLDNVSEVTPDFGLFD